MRTRFTGRRLDYDALTAVAPWDAASTASREMRVATLVVISPPWTACLGHRRRVGGVVENRSGETRQSPVIRARSGDLDDVRLTEAGGIVADPEPRERVLSGIAATACAASTVHGAAAIDALDAGCPAARSGAR